jgi:trans-aconitate 2-methyltransferase
VLVVGCGIGDVSADLAKALEARGGRVLAVDISEKNVATSQKLFHRDNLIFQCCDIIKAPPQDLVWDLILFPDVYEHIPTAARAELHATLNRILAQGGAVALTCPTIQQQRALRAKGEGLQVVDEDVSAEDILHLAHDLKAYLVHFSYLTVFFQHDYFHAHISRIPDSADLQAYPQQPGYLHREVS